MLHAHLFANDLKNSSTSAKGKSLWISSISRSIGTSKTRKGRPAKSTTTRASASRSEEHTSELQSQSNLVCRLLLEKNDRIDRLDQAIADAQLDELPRDPLDEPRGDADDPDRSHNPPRQDLPDGYLVRAGCIWIDP